MAMQIIQTAPRKNHRDLSSGDLFKELLETGNWTIKQVADELDVSEDSVKGWLYREVSPRGNNRRKLIQMIYDFSTNNKLAKKWTGALTQSWVRKRSKTHSAKNTVLRFDHSLPLPTSYDNIPESPVDIYSDASYQPENTVINNTTDKQNSLSKSAGANNEKTQQRLAKFIYFAAAFLFVLVAVTAYAKNPNQLYYLLQIFLLGVTAIPIVSLLFLGAFNKLTTVFIWYIARTCLLGCLLILYFSFFMDNALQGRLAATVAISPMILLLVFNSGYLMMRTLRFGFYQVDKKHMIMRTLMRPLNRYRKNFMHLLELRWFFATGSFAILAVANLYLLVPGLGFIVK